MHDSAPSPLRNLATRLDAMSGVLGVALAQWAVRDDTRAQPEIRQAANTAMAAIDDALTALHRARGQLVSEIRASDDASAARADAMLAAARESGVNHGFTSGQPQGDPAAPGSGCRS